MPDNPEWGYVPTVPQTGLVMTLQPPASWGTAQTIVFPAGQTPVDQPLRVFAGYTTTTIEVDQEARVLYLGRVEKAITTATVLLRVDVISTKTLLWAEVAICAAVPGPGANVKLNLLGYADALSAFGSTGVKVLSVTLTGCVAGTHIWLVWAAHDDAGAGMEGLFCAAPDYLCSGMFQVAAATRPSTMGVDKQFVIAADTVEPVWACVGLS